MRALPDGFHFPLTLGLFLAIATCSYCFHPFLQTIQFFPRNSFMSTEENTWRLVSTAMLVPMLLEFFLDEVVWFLYPTLRTHAKEDPMNHFIVMISLLPASLLPCWIMQGISMQARNISLSIGKLMAIYGLLGKMETFSAQALGISFPSILLSLYAVSECCFVYGIHTYNPNAMSTAIINTSDITTHMLDAYMCACVSVCMKLGLLVFIVISPRVYRIILTNPHEQSLAFFTDNRYICTVLFVGLVMVVCMDVVCMYQTLSSISMDTYTPNLTQYKSPSHSMSAHTPNTCDVHDENNPCDTWQIDNNSPAYLHLYMAYRIACHAVIVVMMAVLPGRITRRGLAAAEEGISLMREMQHKKTFVRYISHELRSPLSTTSLGLDCLLDLLMHQSQTASETNPLPLSELIELTQDCKSTTTSAIHTLNDLLLYDKIENKMLQLEKEEVDGAVFVDGCVRPMEKQIKFSGLNWNVVIDPLVSDVSLFIDRHKMEQVLRNFISNAMKFTPSGGNITMTAKVLDEDSSREKVFRCEVSDTGPGISPENQSELFGQYVQFDVNKLQKGGGSGLGLWLSKSIVEEHGGSVGVRSKGVGWGATFFFEIPVYRMGRIKEKEARELQGEEDGEDDEQRESWDNRNNTVNEKVVKDEDKGSIQAELTIPRHSLPTVSEEELPWRETESLVGDGSVVKEENVADGLLESPRRPPLGPTTGSSIALPSFPPTSVLPTLIVPPRGHSGGDSDGISLGASLGLHSASRESIDNARGIVPDEHGGITLQILIADDAALTRKIIERLLRSTTIYLSNSGKTEPSTCSSSTGGTAATARALGASMTTTSSSSTPHSRVSSTPSSPRQEEGVSATLPPTPLHNHKSLGIADSVMASRTAKAGDMDRHPGQMGTKVNLVIDHASNGQIALDKVLLSLHPWRPSPYHIVLVDYYMPVLDGVGACLGMRNKGYDGVVIGVTGSSSKEDMDKMLAAGVDEVMIKPFNMAEFKKIVLKYFAMGSGTGGKGPGVRIRGRSRGESWGGITSGIGGLTIGSVRPTSNTNSTPPPTPPTAYRQLTSPPKTPLHSPLQSFLVSKPKDGSGDGVSVGAGGDLLQGVGYSRVMSGSDDVGEGGMHI